MTTWKLDKAHTQINFSAKHMMVTTVRGTFDDVDGTIELDEADPTRSFGEFKVATASIDTNFGARDTHLRSADFFDVEQHPYLTFVSTKVEQTGDDQFKVTGDLTIREITKPVTFDVELDGHAWRPPCWPLREGDARARRLGSQLERRPRAGWLAGRQGDQARHHGRGR